MRNRARISPSWSTTWSRDASQSSVSAGSMSGSWCLNSSKYMSWAPVGAAAPGPASGRRDLEGRVEDAGDEHRLVAGDPLVLAGEGGVHARDRIRVGRRFGDGRQGAAAGVDRDPGVGDHFLVPAGSGAANRPDEDLVAIDDDPYDRSMGGSPWHCGLDLDLL